MTDHELDKIEDNKDALGEALNRLESAITEWDDSFNLLAEKDLSNDALIRDITIRIDRISKECTSSAAWLRQYARHRMS